MDQFKKLCDSILVEGKKQNEMFNNAINIIKTVTTLGAGLKDFQNKFKKGSIRLDKGNTIVGGKKDHDAIKDFYDMLIGDGYGFDLHKGKNGTILIGDVDAYTKDEWETLYSSIGMDPKWISTFSSEFFDDFDPLYGMAKEVLYRNKYVSLLVKNVEIKGDTTYNLTGKIPEITIVTPNNSVLYTIKQNSINSIVDNGKRIDITLKDKSYFTIIK